MLFKERSLKSEKKYWRFLYSHYGTNIEQSNKHKKALPILRRYHLRIFQIVVNMLLTFFIDYFITFVVLLLFNISM